MSDETSHTDHAGSDRDWVSFSERLARIVERMNVGQHLILTVADPARDAAGVAYYVQFASRAETFRAEAISNRYLQDPWKLSASDEAALLRLGWIPPDPET